MVLLKFKLMFFIFCKFNFDVVSLVVGSIGNRIDNFWLEL